MKKKGQKRNSAGLGVGGERRLGFKSQTRLCTKELSKIDKHISTSKEERGKETEHKHISRLNYFA